MGTCFRQTGNEGQLGHNDNETGSFPREVVAMRKKSVIFVACGERHTLFLKKSGGLYSGMSCLFICYSIYFKI